MVINYQDYSKQFLSIRYRRILVLVLHTYIDTVGPYYIVSSEDSKRSTSKIR